MQPIILTKRQNAPLVDLSKDTPKMAIKIIDEATSYKMKNADRADLSMYKCPNTKCGWWILQVHATSDYCKRCGTQCVNDYWDGIIRLLSENRNGTYSFPTGLSESVENTLERAGYSTHHVGWPSEPHGGEPLIDLDWAGWKLRSHQDEAFTRVLERLRQGPRKGTILEMATASGKSLLALALIREIGTTTLILVHQKKLMEQWDTGIQETLGWKPSLFGDKQKEIGPITIGMVQSIANANFPINNFNFVIADECHRTPAKQTYNILKKSNAYYRFGMSATPTREDGNEMKMFAVLGPILKVSSIKELIKLGVLAKPTIEFINAPRGKEGETYADAYRNQIVANLPRNVLIANKANELAKQGLSTLITVNQIKHGKTLEHMIPGSKFVHGKTKKDERIKILEDFEEGKIKVVVSTLLKEGADIPTLDAIILAAGGKSEGAQLQKVGRALRTTETKKTALIIDVLDNGKWLRDHAQGRVMLYKETF